MDRLKASDPNTLWRRYALSVAAILALAITGLASIERGMIDAQRQAATTEKAEALKMHADHVARHAHGIVFQPEDAAPLVESLISEIDAFEATFKAVAVCDACRTDPERREAALYGGPAPSLADAVGRFAEQARKVAKDGVKAVSAEQDVAALHQTILAPRFDAFHALLEELSRTNIQRRLWTARVAFGGVLLVVAAQGALVFLQGFRTISNALRWRDAMLVRLEATGAELRAALGVSERARVEVERARQAEASANAIKSEFLARLSHEVRTPLNAILGVSALLVEKRDCAPEDRRRVAAIREAGLSIATVFEDMIELSRLHAGEMRLAPAPFDPRALAAARIARIGPRAEAVGVAFNLAVSPEVEDRYLADGGRIARVIDALLANAVTHAPGGPATLCIAPWGEMGLRVELRDSGPGVPADMSDRIFERFTQADGTERRRAGGLGIGLALAREVIRAMGGAMGVTDASGGGARFWFETPALPMEAAALDRRA